MPNFTAPLSAREQAIIRATHRAAPTHTPLMLRTRGDFYAVFTYDPAGRTHVLTGRTFPSIPGEIIPPMPLHALTTAYELDLIPPKVAAALTPPRPGGPLLPLLFASREHRVFHPLFLALHALAPEAGKHLGWALLWRHAPAKRRIKPGTVWKHWNGQTVKITAVHERSFQTEQGGEVASWSDRLLFLCNHAPVPLKPTLEQLPKGERSEWDDDWTDPRLAEYVASVVREAQAAQDRT